MTRNRAIPFVKLLLVLAGGAAWLSAQEPVYQVVISADPVAVNVSVTDARGRAVTNLTPADFTILEDNEPQQIKGVRSVGMPYSILMLVDRSPKREKPPWGDLLLKSVDTGLKILRGPDRYAVAAFDDRVAVLVDWRPLHGTKQTVLIRPSSQETQFYDAIEWAAQEMRGIRGRKGVIVFTDGRDREMYPAVVRKPDDGKNTGKNDNKDIESADPGIAATDEIPGKKAAVTIDPNYRVPDPAEDRFQLTLQAVAQSRIPFYFVAADTDVQLPETAASAKLPGWVSFLAGVRGQIEQLADVSGGQVSFPRTVEDVLPLFHQLQLDLSSAYLLEYTPARSAGDNKPRQIEVRVRNESYRVTQAQHSYYAR